MIELNTIIKMATASYYKTRQHALDESCYKLAVDINNRSRLLYKWLAKLKDKGYEESDIQKIMDRLIRFYFR